MMAKEVPEIIMEQIVRTPGRIGEAIRRRRRKLGLSQAALGERTGLRQATVSTLESEGAGTLRTLCSLLAALDLELVMRPRTKAAPDEIEKIF